MEAFTDGIEEFELSGLDGLEGLSDFEGLEFLDDFDGEAFDALDESFETDLELDSEVEDNAYAAVLEGALEAAYELEDDPESFAGGLVLRRIARWLGRVLARWAKRVLGSKLKRYGKRAVSTALALMKQVAKKTVKDTLRYARRTRTYRPIKLLRYARKRFWQLMRQALASRGIRVSLESEFI